MGYPLVIHLSLQANSTFNNKIRLSLLTSLNWRFINMKHFFALTLIAIVLCAAGCTKKTKPNNNTPPASPNGIKFRSGSLNSNLAKAKSENKPVFLDFYTTWCAPCKYLDQDVFSHQFVYDYYNDNFINLKIDAEKGEGPKIKDKYFVSAYPTLIFLDSEGNEIERHVGGTGTTKVMNMAKKVVQANKAVQ